MVEQLRPEASPVTISDNVKKVIEKKDVDNLKSKNQVLQIHTLNIRYIKLHKLLRITNEIHKNLIPMKLSNYNIQC